MKGTPPSRHGRLESGLGRVGAPSVCYLAREETQARRQKSGGAEALCLGVQPQLLPFLGLCLAPNSEPLVGLLLTPKGAVYYQCLSP